MAKVREMRAVAPWSFGFRSWRSNGTFGNFQGFLFYWPGDDGPRPCWRWLLALASALWRRRQGFGSCVACWDQVGTQGRQMSTSMSAAGEYTGFVPDMQRPGKVRGGGIQEWLILMGVGAYGFWHGLRAWWGCDQEKVSRKVVADAVDLGADSS